MSLQLASPPVATRNGLACLLLESFIFTDRLAEEPLVLATHRPSPSAFKGSQSKQNQELTPFCDFDEASETDAGQVYAQYIGGAEPSAADYKTLQDVLFRYVAREAGRLGLAVHIHCIDGAGGYYRMTGSNPLLLESVFNDPSLRKTSFVLVHGGYPFTRQTASLMQKPNAYADFSAQTFILYPRALSEILRSWLEWYPEKILFGTDAFIVSPEVDWPELAWLSNATGRQALALALTGMMNDGEITRTRAVELARMVLRENAIKLYQLPSKQSSKLIDGICLSLRG